MTNVRHVIRRRVARLFILPLLFAGASIGTAKADGDTKFTIGDGAYQMTAPAGWVRKQPRTKIVEHEFEIPPATGDENPGRATVMGAGGSIDDNIDRWAGQFTQPDGSGTREKHTKTKKFTIAGQDVTVVEIDGTYEDKPIPFAPGPGTPRPDYRMLSAIVQTKKAGNYFIKFYGPAKTVAASEAGFMKMLEGLEAK